MVVALRWQKVTVHILQLLQQSVKLDEVVVYYLQTLQWTSIHITKIGSDGNHEVHNFAIHEGIHLHLLLYVETIKLLL